MSSRFSTWSLEAIWSFIIQPSSSCGISDDQASTEGSQSLLGSSDECGLYDALKEILLRQDDYPTNVLYPPDVRHFLLRILSEHHSPEVLILACQILVQMCSKTAGMKEKLAHDGVIACLISIIKSHPIPLKPSREMGEREPPCDWEACRLIILLLIQLTSWLQSFALGSPLCIAKMNECDVIHVLMRIIDSDNQNVFSHGSSNAFDSLVKNHCLVAKRHFMRRQASSSVCNELFGDSYKLCVSLYNGHYLLDLYDTSTDTDVHILDELYKRNEVWRYDPVTRDVDIDNTIADEKAGQWVDVLVMDVINSSYFWAVFGDDFSLLRDISRILNSVELCEIDCRPKPGQHVIALKEQNGLPYRAQVVTLLDDGALCCVFAIDYGFIEKKYCVDLMKLPSEPKLTITGLAHLCKVTGSRQKPVSAQLIENVLGILCNLSSDNLGCCINVMLERRLVDNLIGLCTCPIPAIQSLTIRCLSNLCRCDAVQEQLAKSNVCSTIIDIMERILIKLHRPDCTELMESCVTLLNNLMYQSDRIKDVIVNNKGLHFLMALTGPEVPAVIQSSAVKALRVFVGDGLVTKRSNKLLNDSCCSAPTTYRSTEECKRSTTYKPAGECKESSKHANNQKEKISDFARLNWSESNNSSPRPSDKDRKKREEDLARLLEERDISEEIGGSQNKIYVKSDLQVNRVNNTLSKRFDHQLSIRRHSDPQFKPRNKGMSSKQNKEVNQLEQEKLKIIGSGELKEIVSKNKVEQRCTVEEQRQVSNVHVKRQSEKLSECRGSTATVPHCGDGKDGGKIGVGISPTQIRTEKKRIMTENAEFQRSQMMALSQVASSKSSTCRPSFSERHELTSKCRPNFDVLQSTRSDEPVENNTISEDVPLKSNMSSACALIMFAHRKPDKEKMLEEDDSILKELSGSFLGVTRPDTSGFSSTSISSSDSSDTFSRNTFVASSGKKVNCVMKYVPANSNLSTDDLILQALQSQSMSSKVKGKAIVCGSETSFCTACEDIMCDESPVKKLHESVPKMQPGGVCKHENEPKMQPAGICKHYTIGAARNLFDTIQSKALNMLRPNSTREDNSVKSESVNDQIKRSKRCMSSDKKLKACNLEDNTMHPMFESTSISTICEAEEQTSTEDRSQFSSAASSISGASISHTKSLKAFKVASSRENDFRKKLFLNTLCKDVKQITVDDKSDYHSLTSSSKTSVCSNSSWKTCNAFIMPGGAVKNIKLENVITKCDSDDMINFQEISGELFTPAVASENLITSDKRHVSEKSPYSSTSVTNNLRSSVSEQPMKSISDAKTWIGKAASSENLTASDRDHVCEKNQHSTASTTNSLRSNISVEQLEPQKIILDTQICIGLYEQARQKSEACSQPHINYCFGTKVKLRSNQTNEFATESLFKISFVDVANTICSFLNSADGGSLYFGVSKQYIIQGVVLTRSHRERMQSRLELMLSRFTPSVPHGTIRVFLHKVKRENIVDEIVCDSDKEMKQDRDLMKKRFVIEIRVQHCEPRPQCPYKLCVSIVPVGYVRRGGVTSEIAPEDEYGFYVELFEESIVRQLRAIETNESKKL